MLKYKFLIQKSIVVSLALTGMVCAMDAPPKSKTLEKMEALREDPGSLFSKMPKDLDAQIGKYILQIHCPTAEEMSEAAAGNTNDQQLKLKDAKTGLTFNVFRDKILKAQYKFQSVSVYESPNQSMVLCSYETLDGKGKMTASLPPEELASKHVGSCRGDATFRVKQGRSFSVYETTTSNAKDIAITCLTK